MATWLTDINMLELSPVKRPANKKRAIMRKSEDSMIENLTARLEKAELDEAQKQAVMAALDALEMAKEGMDPEAFEAAMSALASLMMPEVPEEEPMDVDAEDGPKPDMEESEKEEDSEEEKGEEEKEEKACDEMDKEEVEKNFEQVEKSEDFQALLKARDDELAELRKSLAEKDEAMTVKSYQEKAESFGNVPMEKGELVQLLRLVDEHGGEQLSKSLGQMLDGIGAVVENSDAFQEIGGSGDASGGKEDAMGRIDALADGVVQKSEKSITREQAIARVLDENPALYTEWLNQG